MKQTIACSFAILWACQAQAASTFEGAAFYTRSDSAAGFRSEQIYNESYFSETVGLPANYMSSGTQLYLDYSQGRLPVDRKYGRKVSALMKTADFNFFASLVSPGTEKFDKANRDTISATFLDRKSLRLTGASLGARSSKLSNATSSYQLSYHEGHDAERGSASVALIPLSREVQSTYTMVTIYVMPDTVTPSGWPADVAYGGSAYFMLHEAEIVGGHVVLGAEVTAGLKIGFDLSAAAMERWSKSYYSYLAPTYGADVPKVESALFEGGLNNRHYPDANKSPWAFLEDVQFITASAPDHRQKRCAEDGWFTNFLRGILYFWPTSRLDACPAPRAPAQGPSPIEIIETQPLASPLLTLVDSHLSGVDNVDSFAQAMNYQVCLDRPFTEDIDEGQCTPEERAALTSVAELSQAEIRSAAAAVDNYLTEAEQGAGSTLLPVTPSPALNAIITTNPSRALVILNRAAAIAYHSGMNATPNAPLAPRVDTVRGKKKKKGVVSAVCSTKSVDADDGFQCVTQGVRKRRPATEQVDVINLPARIRGPGRFYRPTDSANYTPLARAVTNNNGVTLPPGMRSADFNSGTGYIAAIAYDGAPVGQNLSVVYLPNVARQPSDRRRFSYGLQHIWTTSPGGHQLEWESFGIRSADMLTELIMSGLISQGPVEIGMNRGQAGDINYIRNYAAVSFNYGGFTYVATNINIVLGANGMVITAYPSTRRRNMSTLSRTKELK